MKRDYNAKIVVEKQLGKQLNNVAETLFALDPEVRSTSGDGKGNFLEWERSSKLRYKNKNPKFLFALEIR
jgi:hypothetical protein